MITLKEIADNLKISVSTVSKALHDHPSIGLVTKEKVKKLAAELNYIPNETAIHFKQKKTFTLGVILPNLLDQFYSLAVNGIENFSISRDYNVLICQTHEHLAREKQLVSIMQRSRVDGLIISISKETTDLSHIIALEQSGIPVVFFVRKPANLVCHNVTSDVYKGATEAINLLISRGHKRIAYINGPPNWVASIERFLGYRDALVQNNIRYDPALVKVSDLSPESTRQAVRSLLAVPHPPTAMLAFKDYIVLDAIQYLKTLPGKKPEFEFIGFGGLPLFEYLEHPPLASLVEQHHQIGERAAELALKLIENRTRNPLEVALPCTLKMYSS